MNNRRHLLLSGVFAALSTYALAADADSAKACDVANENNQIPFCSESNVTTAAGDTLHSPEIDGAGAITAGAMLAGILALVGERRRRKDL